MGYLFSLKSRAAEELKKVFLHFVVGGCGLTLFFTLLFSKPFEWPHFLMESIFNGSLWVALGLGNGYLVDWLDTKMPWLKMPVSRALTSLLLTIVYSIGVTILIFVGFLYLAYGRPPLDSLQNIDHSLLISVIVITMLISLFLHGRGFFFAWKNAFQEAEESKRAVLAAQYESLRNQVNPHFLFNSFNVLSSLVYKDQDLAARFIKQLSKVYRYVLEVQNEEVVPLEKELEVLEAYLFLLKIRFQDALEVDMQLSPREGYAILPLTLQMLTENAIKHNIASRQKPLKLEFFFQNDTHICVKNTLQLRGDQQDSIGVGLPNIKARYQYLGPHKVEVKQEENTFTVSIPLIELKEV